MKKFLLGLFICLIFGNASATTVTFAQAEFPGEYLPFNYEFSQPVNALSVEVGYFIPRNDAQYISFNSVVEEGIIGASLFAEDGTQVGMYQDINNLDPATVVFSKAEFFLTRTGIGSFDTLDPGFLPSDCSFITCTYSKTNFELSTRLAQLSFEVSANPVPEPGSYVLMMSGLGFLGLISRRRRFHKVDQA